MYDSVIIKNEGNFRLEVLLSGIANIPAPNWRRVCKLIWKYAYLNQGAISTLADWFPQAIKNAKADVEQTERVYFALRKDPEAALKGKKTEAKESNRLLLQNSKGAKRKKQRLEANYKIFLEVV